MARDYRRAGHGGAGPVWDVRIARWRIRDGLAGVKPSGLGLAGRDTLTIVGDGTASIHDLLEFSASAVETDLDGEEAHSQKDRDLGGRASPWASCSRMTAR